MAPRNPYDFSDQVASMGITGLLAMIKQRYQLDDRTMATIRIVVH